MAVMWQILWNAVTSPETLLKKVEVQVYSLISSLISSAFTSYPLVTGPVHSCAISTPRRADTPAAVSAHWTYRAHCHLCPTMYSFSPESSEAFEGEVPYPKTQHLNNVPRLRGEKHDIYLTIAPCPSLLNAYFVVLASSVKTLEVKAIEFHRLQSTG